MNASVGRLRTLFALLAVCVAGSACEEKKKPPAPAPEASAEPEKKTAAKDDDDDDEAEKPVALPPGVTALPSAEPPPEQDPRTGMCSVMEQGYDGMDTRSTEKLIVKVKEDVIVGAKYSYRGSYALDGEADNLNIPFRDKKWIGFELAMTSGKKEFKIRVKDNVMDVKGTAASEPQGDCVWEDVDRKDKRRMKRK